MLLLEFQSFSLSLCLFRSLPSLYIPWGHIILLVCTVPVSCLICLTQGIIHLQLEGEGVMHFFSCCCNCCVLIGTYRYDALIFVIIRV